MSEQTSTSNNSTEILQFML